jgi:hypothetical protein
MDETHFYHVYAAGAWRAPVAEHFAGLRDASYAGDVRLGLIGSPDEIADVERYLTREFPGVPYRVAVTASRGYEQVTLRALRAYAQDAPPGQPVFYAHSKGASYSEDLAAAWRHAMWHCNVISWQQMTAELAGGGYDVAGCHWLTRETVLEAPPGFRGKFFAGNYWHATAGYLASLEPVSGADRHDAETWIGTGDPRVFDFAPGGPGGIRPHPLWHGGRFVFLCHERCKLTQPEQA